MEWRASSVSSSPPYCGLKSWVSPAVVDGGGKQGAFVTWANREETFPGLCRGKGLRWWQEIWCRRHHPLLGPLPPGSPAGHHPSLWCPGQGEIGGS